MSDEFKVHLLNEKGVGAAVVLAAIFDKALADIDTVLAGKPSRERSIVVTKMQEASFWAKRAMALNPEMQIVRVDEQKP